MLGGTYRNPQNRGGATILGDTTIDTSLTSKGIDDLNNAKAAQAAAKKKAEKDAWDQLKFNEYDNTFKAGDEYIGSIKENALQDFGGRISEKGNLSAQDQSDLRVSQANLEKDYNKIKSFQAGGKQFRQNIDSDKKLKNVTNTDFLQEGVFGLQNDLISTNEDGSKSLNPDIDETSFDKLLDSPQAYDWQRSAKYTVEQLPDMQKQWMERNGGYDVSKSTEDKGLWQMNEKGEPIMVDIKDENGNVIGQQKKVRRSPETTDMLMQQRDTRVLVEDRFKQKSDMHKQSVDELQSLIDNAQSQEERDGYLQAMKELREDAPKIDDVLYDEYLSGALGSNDSMKKSANPYALSNYRNKLGSGAKNNESANKIYADNVSRAFTNRVPIKGESDYVINPETGQAVPKSEMVGEGKALNKIENVFGGMTWGTVTDELGKKIPLTAQEVYSSPDEQGVIYMKMNNGEVRRVDENNISQFSLNAKFNDKHGFESNYFEKNFVNKEGQFIHSAGESDVDRQIQQSNISRQEEANRRSQTQDLSTRLNDELKGIDTGFLDGLDDNEKQKVQGAISNLPTMMNKQGNNVKITFDESTGKVSVDGNEMEAEELGRYIENNLQVSNKPDAGDFDPDALLDEIGF